MAIKIAVPSVQEIAEKIQAEQIQAVESSLVNKVVVRVESRSGNLNDGKNAIGQGLIYGRIVRIIKGSEILFESADGELNSRPLKKLIDGQFAMSVGVQQAADFARSFHKIRPEESGARRCECEFAFSDYVFVNSNATIQAEGMVSGDLKAPQGQPIGSADEFDKLFTEKTAASRDYRKSARESYRRESLQQLQALNGVNSPVDQPSDQTSIEVENLNTI